MRLIPVASWVFLYASLLHSVWRADLFEVCLDAALIAGAGWMYGYLNWRVTRSVPPSSRSMV